MSAPVDTASVPTIPETVTAVRVTPTGVVAVDVVGVVAAIALGADGHAAATDASATNDTSALRARRLDDTVPT
jgi:hypothetical protein